MLSNNAEDFVFLTEDEWEKAAQEYQDGGYVPGSFVKQLYVVTPGEGFQYGKVFENQSADVHPPLYYCLVHTISSLFPGTYSKWYALGINLVCMLLIDTVLYRIGCLLLKNRYYAVIPCVCLIMSCGFSYTLAYARMYTLLSLWLILYIYLHVKMLEGLKKHIGTDRKSVV